MEQTPVQDKKMEDLENQVRNLRAAMLHHKEAYETAQKLLHRAIEASDAYFAECQQSQYFNKE